LPYSRLIAALVGLLLPGCVSWAQWEEGRILKPVDGSVFAGGKVEVIATAPDGRLELDGKPLKAESPFPDVLHGKVSAAPGEHTLSLKWDGGGAEVRFFVGDDPPEGFQPFRPHPPSAAVECAHCHGVSRRGRFRFTGGCWACHSEDAFPKAHTHRPHRIEQCGMCHNAHGSTEAALLLYPKRKACAQCHPFYGEASAAGE